MKRLKLSLDDIKKLIYTLFISLFIYFFEVFVYFDRHIINLNLIMAKTNINLG